MRENKKKIILTIAGSDPCGGAGLQADLRTFQEQGFLAYSVVTAVTAQNEKKIISVNPVSPKVLRDQLKSVGRCDYVKIGMLGTKAIVREVIRYIKNSKPKIVVLDPVLCSSTGKILLETSAITDLKKLFSLCTLVTPNLSEASILSKTSVHDVASMKAAARIILKNSPGLKAVLVKGGHLKKSATDILYDGKRFYEFKGKRFPKSFHGTGCVLSSLITALLVVGDTLKEAITKAKKNMFF